MQVTRSMWCVCRLRSFIVSLSLSLLLSTILLSIRLLFWSSFTLRNNVQLTFSSHASCCRLFLCAVFLVFSLVAAAQVRALHSFVTCSVESPRSRTLKFLIVGCLFFAMRMRNSGLLSIILFCASIISALICSIFCCSAAISFYSPFFPFVVLLGCKKCRTKILSFPFCFCFRFHFRNAFSKSLSIATLFSYFLSLRIIPLRECESQSLFFPVLCSKFIIIVCVFLFQGLTVPPAPRPVVCLSFFPYHLMPVVNMQES